MANEGTLKIVRLLSGTDVIGTAYETEGTGSHSIAIVNPAKLIVMYEPTENMLTEEEGEMAGMSYMVTLGHYQPYSGTDVAVFPYHAIESICDVNNEMAGAYQGWTEGSQEQDGPSLDAIVPEGTLFS